MMEPQSNRERTVGWSWRKSENLGPFRINLSSGGIGYSVGGRGFHVGVNARGRKYVSAGLPGTGLRYNSTLGRGGGGGAGCLSMILLPLSLLAAGLIAFAELKHD
jgi:hypothetical protein